jgi:hypothetical protein
VVDYFRDVKMTKVSSSGRRWVRERAPSTAQGRRVRLLYRAFIAPLKADDPVHQAAAMSAAELTVAAEDARARLLAGDPSAEQQVVRLENTARRAKFDLAELTPKPTSWWQQQQHETDDDGEESEAA